MGSPELFVLYNNTRNTPHQIRKKISSSLSQGFRAQGPQKLCAWPEWCLPCLSASRSSDNFHLQTVVTICNAVDRESQGGGGEIASSSQAKGKVYEHVHSHPHKSTQTKQDWGCSSNNSNNNKWPSCVCLGASSPPWLTLSINGKQPTSDQTLLRPGNSHPPSCTARLISQEVFSKSFAWHRMTQKSSLVKDQEQKQKNPLLVTMSRFDIKASGEAAFTTGSALVYFTEK